MSKGKFTQKQRDLCWERAEGHCEVCGCRLREKGWNLHHRQGRGMGGTKRPMTCSDGLVVCGSGTTGCHGLIEKERQWAITRGFLVPRSSGRLPCEVPVLVRGENMWLLADGGVSRVAEWGDIA